MSRITELIKTSLLRQGVHVMRPCGNYNVLQQKLECLRSRGLNVRAAIDGGAATGHWTQVFKSVFPRASVLCIDPRADVQNALMALKQAQMGINVANVALGATEGSCEINEHGDQTSLLNNSKDRQFGRRNRVRMTTLDSLVREFNVPNIDYIKLDLQGGELSALDGAVSCMKVAQAIQLEVSWLPFQAGMPLVADVIQYMRERHFVWYDILGFWHRPLDGALAQADAVFLKDDHPLRASGEWDGKSSFS